MITVGTMTGRPFIMCRASGILNYGMWFMGRGRGSLDK